MPGRIDHLISPQVQQDKHKTSIKRNTPLGGQKGTTAKFSQVLREKQLGQATLPTPQKSVRFSAHAERRLKERNIELGAADLLEIDKALKQVAAKGSRESLLVYGDLALITSVKNRTVVTALEKGEMNGRVFTNIDSTVLIDK